jgi:hypothetical protein
MTIQIIVWSVGRALKHYDFQLIAYVCANVIIRKYHLHGEALTVGIM